MNDHDGNRLPAQIHLHEDGAQTGSVHLPTFEAAVTRLVFNLAANSSDNDELSRLLEEAAAEVPPDLAASFFSSALGLMTTTIVELILTHFDDVDPGNDVRLRLIGHAADANVRLRPNSPQPGDDS